MAEPKCTDSHGMTVTWKDYVDGRFKESEAARKTAVEVMDHRLAGMNEFRETLRDQAAKFLTREEYNTAHDRIEEDIRMLRESKAMLEGKANQSSLNVTIGIAITGLLLSVVTLAVHLMQIP
jgi:hypothetical protein